MGNAERYFGREFNMLNANQIRFLLDLAELPIGREYEFVAHGHKCSIERSKDGYLTGSVVTTGGGLIQFSCDGHRDYIPLSDASTQKGRTYRDFKSLKANLTNIAHNHQTQPRA